MARITVAYDALERGQFPPVCCRTGDHTDHYVRLRFTDTPGWTWVLLPFGVLPFIVARLFVTTTYDGVLPLSQEAENRIKALARAALVAGVAGVASIVAGLLTSGSGLAVIGLALLGVGVVCVIAGTIASPDTKRDVARGAVELRNVHRDFVRTIEAAWAQNQQSP